MSTETEAVVDRLMEQVTEQNSVLGAMLGDSDLKGVFSGMNEIHNNKAQHVIYDTSTGEPRNIPVMYLKAAMKKKRTITLADGTPKVIDAFVVQNPETGKPYTPVPEYVVGDLKCFLHPGHPERAWLASIGVGMEIVCGDNETQPASHLPTEFHRNLHELKKHPLSYKAREDARTRERERESIDRQERQIEAMMAMASGRVVATQSDFGDSIFRCPSCPRFFDTEQGLKVHAGQHKEG